MSLEQALAENTAAMNRLVTVLTTATEAQASFAVSAGAAQAAAAPAETKTTRTRKSTAAAADATTTAVTTAPAATTTTTTTTATDLGPVVEGDEPGTRYFVIPKHNTVCAIPPGHSVPNMESQIEVSGANYLIAKAQLAAKFATAPAPTATTTQATVTTAPTATAQQVVVPEGPTFEQVVAKARELHALKNNEGLQVVLAKFGAASVPALQGKAPNAQLIAAFEAEMVVAPAAAAPANFF